MRNLTNQLVALLLAFITVCSLSLAIVNADNKKEDETSQSEAQVVIQTYQIKTDETTENSESASFLNLFNKRLSMKNTDCEHEFDEITVTPTCKRVGYSVLCCYFCDFVYMDKPVLFYQFDQDEFFSKQYVGNDAEYPFGDIEKDEEDLIKKVASIVDGGFVMQRKYKKDAKGFYKYRDKKNCERVYKLIRSL